MWFIPGTICRAISSKEMRLKHTDAIGQAVRPTNDRSGTTMALDGEGCGLGGCAG